MPPVAALQLGSASPANVPLIAPYYYYLVANEVAISVVT